MSILRTAARTMLASFFVVNGAKAVRDPEPLVGQAEKIAQTGVSLAQKLVPPSVAGYLPENTKSWVRINGATQCLGGLALATGIGRRGGAALVALSMLPHVLASRPTPDMSADDKKASRSVLLRNMSLLGGAMLAAQDTQGKPSLAWRASDGARRIEKKANKQMKSLSKDADGASRKLKRKARKLKNSAEKQVGDVAKTLGV